MNKDHISGGKLLVSCLSSLNAKTIFGVPGESYLPFLDALYDSKINFITCRQEGAACFSASAWGKLTGQPGLCFVTRGPGATNASIGIHTAMQDSSPMILFIGQVHLKNKGREGFQEINHTAFFEPITKWVTEINDINRIPEIVARAWHISLSGRPGPVVISIPENIFKLTAPKIPYMKVTISEAGVNTLQFNNLKSILSDSKKILVIVGGSGWKEKGKNDLQKFCEREKIPIISSFRYHDIIDNNSPIYIGDAGIGMVPHISKAIKDADVIIGINIRFGEATTKAWNLLNIPFPNQKIIHIHASDKELGKIYQPDISFHAGPNIFSSALLGIKLDKSNKENRIKWLKKLKVSYKNSLKPPKQDSPVDMSEIMSWLQKNLKEDVIITNGAGNFALWPNKVFAYGSKQNLLAPQSGAMGYGLPAAIAACIAHPNRQVICFTGDGDIQMCLSELGTCVENNINPIIIILNNNSYGTIRMHQERNYPGRVYATNLKNPDFSNIAKAYGLIGIKVNKTKDFAKAFKKILKSSKGGIIDLEISINAITPYSKL